ncbi:MAG: VOC family protein [Solirubrobacterales bacterium]
MATRQVEALEGGLEVGDDGVRHPVLHHVNLKTTRLGEMIAWYGLAAGLRPNFRNEVIAFLSNDEANHRLALVAVPGIHEDPEKVPHAGIHHTAFEFASLEDLLARYRTLKAAGYVPHGCLDHGLTMSFYYLDPDGNSVELQSDNFGDWTISADWMRTSQDFVADPIGKFVDPDQLCEASAAGMSAEEIHHRAFAAEFEPDAVPDMRLPAP